MPHYDPELELCVLDPLGRPVALAILWYDGQMPYCELDPLGVAWWERRRGIATALLHEATNRMKRKAPECRAMLGGDQAFYRRIGYELKTEHPVYEWNLELYISWEKESFARDHAAEL